MYHIQQNSMQKCRLIAVLCGKYVNTQREGKPKYPFPKLVSLGRLEVHQLINPKLDEFRDAYKSIKPSFLYLQGAQLENEEELGSLVWGTRDVSDPELLDSLIGPHLPTVVYLDVQKSEKIALTLHTKGVPYVIYWNTAFSTYASSHFRHALFSVVQSSFNHMWDAFQLAFASFWLYCVRNNHGFPANSQTFSSISGPILLGDAPKMNVTPQEKPVCEEETFPFDMVPNIKIHDNDVVLRFLICGPPPELDARLLGSLEDGLNALLNIEIRGSNLRNPVSAAPPILEAGTMSRGVVTVKCDFTTCSYAYFSVLVSGGTKVVFDEPLLESLIKKELIENRYQLVRALPQCGEKEPSTWSSLAIAAGAPCFEVSMKAPAWASEILKYLAHELWYRSLVSLGIGCIGGFPVASFDKEDADRLLFFCTRSENELRIQDNLIVRPPKWSAPLTSDRELNFLDNKDRRFKRGFNIAAMRPIPPTCRRQELSLFGTGSKFKAASEFITDWEHDILPKTYACDGISANSNLANSASSQISLNPLPLEKHGCNRKPLGICSEKEFLEDVFHYLTLRGYKRLVPEGGVSEFPDAILNGRRLDLFNLYREVVYRGGFDVAEGINWRGQVFSKMHNHTESHRMTGIGSVLKRHYMTYLFEYELAHDDVEAECCTLCNSGAPGDWLNCGLCGRWAHYYCDGRPSLATFKDYKKDRGLEYKCPRCSEQKQPQDTTSKFS